MNLQKHMIIMQPDMYISKISKRLDVRIGGYNNIFTMI